MTNNPFALRIVKKPVFSEPEWLLRAPEGTWVSKKREDLWLKAITLSRKNGGSCALYSDESEVDWFLTIKDGQERWSDWRDLERRAKGKPAPAYRYGGGMLREH